jgi:hypothetical protein
MWRFQKPPHLLHCIGLKRSHQFCPLNISLLINEFPSIIILQQDGYDSGKSGCTCSPGQAWLQVVGRVCLLASLIEK